MADDGAVGTEERAANAEEQADELEALASIYDAPSGAPEAGDSVQVTVLVRKQPTAEAAAKGEVEVRVSAADKVIILEVSTDGGYPSRHAPSRVLHAKWLGEDACRSLEAKLDELAADAVGGVVLFAWVDALREAMEDATAKRAAAAHAEAVAVAEAEAREAEAAAQAAASGGVGGGVVAAAAAMLARGIPAAMRGVIDGIVTCDPVVDRKSTFQAHAARVTSEEEACAVVAALLSDRKVARATHNMVALRVVTSDGVALHDNDDDGEHGAGAKLAHLLEMLDVREGVVVVTRWYGGTHLGPDRFKHIANTARVALEAAGLSKRAGGAGAGGGGGKRKGAGGGKGR